MKPAAAWGIYINGIGSTYCVFVTFWCAWPPAPWSGPGTFNWAIVIFAGVMLIAMVLYYTGGNKRYLGPVTLVRA